MKSEYIPIQCSLYDYLEAAAVQKQEVQLSYRVGGNNLQVIRGIVLKTETTAGKEEFIHLDTGLKIRLDHIATFNGVDFENGRVCKS